MTPDNRNNDPLDPILRRAMRAQPGPATPECADAESLAAYSDRSLAATERERLGDALCRLHAMPADVGGHRPRRGERARSRVRHLKSHGIEDGASRFPRSRRSPPFSSSLRSRRPANEESQRDQLVAMAKNEAPHAEQEAPAPPPQAAPPAPAPAAAASVLAMNEARSAIVRREVRGMYLSKPAPATAPPAAPESPPAALASAPAASASNVIAMNEAKTESVAHGEAMSAYSSQALHGEAPAPGARAFGALAAGAAATNAGAPAYGSAFAPRSAAVGAGSGAVAGGGTALSLNETASSATMLVTISAPGGSVTWIAGKDGFVQRRDADGATRMQHSGVSTDLIAGSAPSATVCWIVGRSGTIIRTTDGEHWELITAPTAENLAAVSASSAKDATITTAGGQSFATSDSGASWHRQ